MLVGDCNGCVTALSAYSTTTYRLEDVSAYSTTTYSTLGLGVHGMKERGRPALRLGFS